LTDLAWTGEKVESLLVPFCWFGPSHTEIVRFRHARKSSEDIVPLLEAFETHGFLHSDPVDIARFFLISVPDPMTKATNEQKARLLLSTCLGCDQNFRASTGHDATGLEAPVERAPFSNESLSKRRKT
jgi:hypothetical protein